MTLLTRIGRLLRADLNAVLDGLEEPAAVLRQSLCDMQQALARGAEEEARLAREAQRLAGLVETAHAQDARSAEDLALCLDADQDEVARTAMRRRLEAAARLAAVMRERDAQQAQWEACAARLAAQRERLAELEARAALVPGETASEEGPVTWPNAERAITEADITLALHAERARRTRV